jgi:hypothetical protein
MGCKGIAAHEADASPHPARVYQGSLTAPTRQFHIVGVRLGTRLSVSSGPHVDRKTTELPRA